MTHSYPPKRPFGDGVAETRSRLALRRALTTSPWREATDEAVAFQSYLPGERVMENGSRLVVRI